MGVGWCMCVSSFFYRARKIQFEKNLQVNLWWCLHCGLSVVCVNDRKTTVYVCVGEGVCSNIVFVFPKQLLFSFFVLFILYIIGTG